LKPLKPIKDQFDLIKDKGIELLLQSYAKKIVDVQTQVTSTDPCVGDGGNNGLFGMDLLGDPSTYYIAGLLFIIVIGTITTVLVVLDHQPDIN
jgi:hypothetical protein